MTPPPITPSEDAPDRYTVVWRTSPKGKVFYATEQPHDRAAATLLKVLKGSLAWCMVENENGKHKGSGRVDGEQMDRVP